MVQTRLRYLRRHNLLSVIPAGTVDMEVAAFLKKIVFLIGLNDKNAFSNK